MHSCTLRWTKNGTCGVHKTQGKWFLARYQIYFVCFNGSTWPLCFYGFRKRMPYFESINVFYELWIKMLHHFKSTSHNEINYNLSPFFPLYFYMYVTLVAWVPSKHLRLFQFVFSNLPWLLQKLLMCLFIYGLSSVQSPHSPWQL
jgi:hypothetical protein